MRTQNRQVHAAIERRCDRSDPTPVVSVEIETGPAVDAAVELPAGRHLIGRSPGAVVRLDDPAVEAHHLLLDLSSGGDCRILQLAGRLAVTVDGVPTHGWSTVDSASVIELGTTRLRLAPPSAPPAAAQTGDVPGDPWRRMLIRPPRAVPVPPPSTVDAPVVVSIRPEPGGRSGALVGSFTALAAGLLMAWMTGSPLAAVFGGLMAVVAIATWSVTRVRSMRTAARRRQEREDSIAGFARSVCEVARRLDDHHRTRWISTARRLTDIVNADLWARRSTHGDAFTVTVGLGDVDRPAAVVGDLDPDDAEMVTAVVDRYRTFQGVEIPAALDRDDHEVIAVEGPDASSVARGLLLQLAVTTGPADWCLRVIARRPDEHAWVRSLPHAAGDHTGEVVVDAADQPALTVMTVGLDDGDARRVVVWCDAPSLLASRTGPLRRLLDGSRPVTVLLVVEDGSGLPAVCRSALQLGERGTARWTPDLHDTAAAGVWGSVRVRTSGVSVAVAANVAERLARFVDPEDPTVATGRVPRTLRLSDLDVLPLTVEAITAAWQAAGPDPAPCAPLGTSGDGVVEIDLVRDGPHGLVAGTTGSGKSELLRTLVVALAARVSPDHLSFVLVDYKGGSTFDACAELPHTVGLVTDLDGGLAARALRSLEAELHRRERVLREHGAADLESYRRLEQVPPIPRLVVVIDEFAALATDVPDFVTALVGVAQRGRSLGLHLVLATQRPAGVVDDAIRANTNLRLALRVHDVADALDVVGDRGPASFARGVPGRSMLRLGPDEVVEFQAASCTLRRDDGTTELVDLVAAIAAAAERLDLAPPHRPWLPGLDELDVAELDELAGAGAVGVIDEPDAQRRRPLVWGHTGSLALVGALGSGTTTTLVSLGHVTVTSRPAAALHVIDGRGDEALDTLASLPQCSGVVRIAESERLGRLLRRLGAVVDRRGAGATDEVLLVDGLGALRRALDEPGRADEAALLDRILTEGPAAGVVTAAVVEAVGSTMHSVLGRFGERWVFHLDDDSVATTLGVGRALIPPAVPGRIVIASTRAAARLVRVGAPPRSSGAKRVRPIEILSSDLLVDELDVPGPSVPGRSCELRLGRRFDDLEVARLTVSPGDRLMIVGPPGSGRTSAIRLLEQQWRRAHPGHPVVRIAGPDDLIERDAVDRDASPSAGRLIVVDDADRIPDQAGRLAALAADRGPATTMVIAGRADALRSSFDHWSAPARRHRLGVVMASTDVLDGDVLGTAVPRRCPVSPRPGLAWVVAHGSATLVQLARLPATDPAIRSTGGDQAAPSTSTDPSETASAPRR